MEPLAGHQKEFPLLEGFATDEAGFKYVGGQYGLLRLKAGFSDTTRLTYLPNGGVERIIGLAVVGNWLVIGSESGLWQYHLKTRKSKHISATWVPVHAHGMKSDWLGNVCVYCADGLVKYHPDSAELAVFSTLDGIYAINKDWATLFSYNGHMYLGHRMAYTKWKPDLAGKNHNRPVVIITDISVQGKRLAFPPLKEDTILPAMPFGVKNLLFSFTAFENVQPNEIEFEWGLKGYDTIWKKAGSERNALFTSLPAGKYTFEIRALNSSRLVADHPVKVGFVVKQAWWQNPLLVFALLGALVYLMLTLIKKREKRIIDKANAEVAFQKQIGGLQMATLRSQMNPHFIFNSLNSIQKFIWENKQDNSSEYLNKCSPYCSRTRNCVGRSYRQLQFILFYTPPQTFGYQNVERIR